VAVAAPDASVLWHTAAVGRSSSAVFSPQGAVGVADAAKWRAGGAPPGGGGPPAGGALLNYIAVGLGFKLAVEVVCLPLTYRVIAMLKRRESVDTYDTTTNFTPFRLRV